MEKGFGTFIGGKECSCWGLVRVFRKIGGGEDKEGVHEGTVAITTLPMP